MYLILTRNISCQESWSTLIDEDEHDVLEWAACVKEDLLVLGYLHDVKVMAASCIVPFTVPCAILKGSRAFASKRDKP